MIEMEPLFALQVHIAFGVLCLICLLSKYSFVVCVTRGGGTYLERGYEDVRRESPPFHAPSAASKDPLFSILQFHKTPSLTTGHKISQFFFPSA